MEEAFFATMSFPSNAHWVPPAGYAEAFAKELGRVHCEVGKLRVSGSSITKDEEEGVMWLRSAAVSGDGEQACAYSLCAKVIHLGGLQLAMSEWSSPYVIKLSERTDSKRSV